MSYWANPFIINVVDFSVFPWDLTTATPGGTETSVNIP